ncbi:bifunctional diaminohydroxyphosphoribosylaminopyrimidine deaminase/5-amino-6-(5-phosphoribosylamino)uracil reductase RibD [bacterium]|nr:bifunctional diaminohydroxyphosphoribosylaminopyrimidine deaminase/5-amino-6-(5-phosphoribosylamino)uracil reductase RibD [bacterium]
MTRFGPQDAHWMTLALAEAARGKGFVEPNPMVGAVLVSDDRLAGSGHHARFGGPHAEVAALAATPGSARGMTMHVTLEPCCHFGKTPPCSRAIVEAGISRVVIATRDPFPLVSGGGIEELRAAGIHVDVWPVDSPVARQAIRLNRPFFKRVLTGRPYTIAKWAMSLDGRIALATGDSRWISNDRSRAIVHEIRGRVDGILVGIGTVKADDPSLTARPPGPRTPRRIVVDPRAETPIESVLVRTARETPVTIFCAANAANDRRKALESSGCELIPLNASANGSLSPESIVEELGSKGLTNLLIEGGSKVLGRFFDAGCIDEVAVFVAPALFGGPAAFPPIESKSVRPMESIPRLAEVRTSTIGSDTLIQGLVQSDWCATLEKSLSR